jgi:uncharacterized membrane protein YgcG
MKKTIALGLVAVSLAACDKLPFLNGPASPQRKAGLWEQAIQSDQSPTPMVSQACYDAASDRRMPILPRKPPAGGRRQCDKFNVAKNGADYVIDSVCGFGAAVPVKITLHAVISGDFNSKYSVTNNINVEGAPDAARNGAHKSVITATYKGDCPPDIGPGQVKLPTGEVVDMAQLRNRFGGGGGGRGGGGGGGGGGAGGGGGGGQ